MADELFPNISHQNFTPMSPQTCEYNCVGWALQTQNHYIWPDDLEQYAWPPDLPRSDTIDVIRQLFEKVGFAICPTADLEPGFEKIAIYSDNDQPTHVARQIRNGEWTSKLGDMADADHVDLDVLAGGKYGQVKILMKRPTDGSPPPLPDLYPPPPRLITPAGGPLIR